MFDVKIKHRRLCEIDLLEVYSDDGGSNKGIVILFHGHKARKEVLLSQAYDLAGKNIFVLLPDAYGHGEDAMEGAEPDIFVVVRETSAAINKVIEFYREDIRVDHSNVVICGYSMGGFIVYEYLISDDVRIKAAAALISTPDWVSVMKTPQAIEYYSSMGIAEGSFKMNELLEYARSIQPLSLYYRIPQTPLLMINGEDDTLTSKEGAEVLYSLLRPLYDNKGDIVLSLYKGTGHHASSEMDAEMYAWILKYLNGDKTG